jgi:aspartate aminotransferase-like enzyme
MLTDNFSEDTYSRFSADFARIVVIGKGGLSGNVIRTGVMLNATKDTINELIAALDMALAAV